MAVALEKDPAPARRCCGSCVSAALSLAQATVYGLVQGLTEFLPVSSTGHQRIAVALFGLEQPDAGFTAILELGTMAAVVLFFWRELLHVSAAWCRGVSDAGVRATLEYRMGWYLILATVPVAALGLVFTDAIQTAGRNLWLIAAALIAGGFALIAAEWFGRRDREEEQLNGRDAATVGLAQSLSLIAGVSRSGITITAGLFRGLQRETAVRFSLLLSVPALVASSVFEARKVGAAGATGMGIAIFAALVSFGVGLASIAGLLRVVTRFSTRPFAAYRIALGAVLLVLLGTGFLDAT